MKCCGFVFGASLSSEETEAIARRWLDVDCPQCKRKPAPRFAGAIEPPPQLRVPHGVRGHSLYAVRGGRISKTVRQAVYARDGFTCRYCGYRTTDTGYHTLRRTLDHVIPVCAGGKSTADNLVVACSGCNREKGGLLLGPVPGNDEGN